MPLRARLAPLPLLLLAASLTAAEVAAVEVAAEKSERGVKIEVDGKPFTEYLVKSGAKPALWPLISPAGVAVTRSYPVGPATLPGEKEDHIHHRSMWFTHGNVNGVDFWSEQKAHGTIVHREFEAIESEGPTARIVTRNDWLDSKGKRICSDRRTLLFGADDATRWIDCEIVVRANDGKVEFGDTKEGAFGVRVAGTMKVDAGRGGKIVNSRGQTDKEAWGQAAEWVDYFGPVGGDTVGRQQVQGIAIFNHPSSFRFPTYWHVRTYGLFAANPFGLRHFQKKSGGAHTIEPGETMTLRYRVLLHSGDEKVAGISDAFARYAKAPHPTGAALATSGSK